MSDQEESGAWDAPVRLTPEDLDEYRRVVEGRPVPKSSPRLQKLVRLGLVRHGDFDGELVPVDPRGLQAQLMADLRRQMQDAMTRMDGIPGVIGQVETIFTQQRFHIGSGSELLESADQANARISEALEQARTEVLTAQPGSRSKKALDIAAARDVAALHRGRKMRTMYHPSGRANPELHRYVKAISEHGAEVRTVSLDFPRMVIFDGSHAFVDVKLPGAPANSALHLTDPVMVAWVRSMFDLFWGMGDSWGAAVQPAKELVTDPTRLLILKLLVGGLNQNQIAPRVGLSLRLVNKHLSALKAQFDAATLVELGVKWVRATGG